MKTKTVIKAKKQHNPLSLIMPFLEDPKNTEILINGHENFQVARLGKLTDVPSPFKNEAQLIELIQAIAEPMGRRADESHPILDLRLQDGSRVHVVMPPISLMGPVVTIRKAMIGRMTAKDLIESGACSQELLDFLKSCVQGRLNILVAGGSNSGKTTVLTILANMIGDDERVILLQRQDEVLIKKPRVIKLETRPANLEGRGEITMQQLVSSAARLTPERIVTTEIIGAEALELLQVMNSGHNGCMQGMYATSAFDALVRLEEMVGYANPAMPTLSVRGMIASAIDLIVYVERLRSGQRRIVKVSEVTGLTDSVVTLRDIFEFRQLDVKNGEIVGDFQATGNIPNFMSKLQSAGLNLPLAIFTPKTK